MLGMNLQYFAEEGENELETAEPTAEETEVTEEVDEGQEEELEDEQDSEKEDTEVDVETDKKRQTAEINRIAAAARRASENEIRKRDQRIAEKYGNLVNPITKQPIKTEQDYFDALDAQERLQSENELQQKGISPQIIQNVLKGMPEMKILAEIQENLSKEKEERLHTEGLNYLNNEIKIVRQFDPTIKTPEDLDNIENIGEIVALCNKGRTLSEAYKIVNFDKILENKKNQVKQGTINQVRGKAHLQTTSGTAGNKMDIEVSNEQMESLRMAFPNATDSELKKKVQNVL